MDSCIIYARILARHLLLEAYERSTRPLARAFSLLLTSLPIRRPVLACTFLSLHSLSYRLSFPNANGVPSFILAGFRLRPLACSLLLVTTVKHNEQRSPYRLQFVRLIFSYKQVSFSSSAEISLVEVLAPAICVTIMVDVERRGADGSAGKILVPRLHLGTIALDGRVSG